MEIQRRGRAIANAFSLVLAFSVALGTKTSGQQPQRADASSAHRTVGRILGVFDETTGQPIEGVEVYDLNSGNSSLTTKTGTVSLFFIDTTGSVVRLRKLGYQPILVPVANSPRDTTPLTVTLGPAAQNMPTVVTTGHRPLMGPEDTIRKLEQRGFYERRLYTGAPMEAFVSGKILDQLLYLKDIAPLTGRGICENNLYIDGIKVGGALTLPNPFATAANHLPPIRIPSALSTLSVYNVVGMELYTHVAEFPTEYDQTASVGNHCLTLIWTK